MPKRKCKQCLEYSEQWIKQPVGAFCTEAHMYAWIAAKRDKDRAKQVAASKRKASETKREARKARKEYYAKDIQWQHKQTQAVFNRMRVLQEIMWFQDQGKEPECISCGKTKMDWCCGHFKTRGSQSTLRYDPYNTFLQCNRYFNMGLSGNISGDKNTRGYIQGLFDRFGEKRAQEIIDYCETETAPRKFTGLELESMRKEFNKQIKELL